MSRLRSLGCVCFILLLTLSAVSAADSDAYGVSVSQSVDIPDRTLETDSGNYTISAIGQYAEGETVTVSTTGPANTSYAVRLVDSQERSLVTAYVEGTGTREFTLDRYVPGTYAIIITAEDSAEEIYAVEIFVLSGYRVIHSTPRAVEHNTTLTVEFRLEEVSDAVAGPPANVRVALGNASTSLTTTARRTAGLTYTAEIDTQSLAPGEYRLYTGVQRNTTVYGYAELVGVDTYAVTVTEPSTPTATTTATASSQSETQETTSASTPGVGVVVALAALLSGVGLLSVGRRQ
ncbi:PGF-CTERM sorting domain-containing protein [Halobellus rubicundus]|uniref:PGF-CTERM sorting domain-containing protein n=1 Tax=Halobellus rubicundus TaxID=2996466 RepID=A0ABD5MA55_9EURY